MSIYPRPSEELIVVTIQLLPASILGAITVIAVLCLIFRWFGLKKVRSFYVWVSVLAVLGGAWAFLFPLAINTDFSKNGDGAALRQIFLCTTGGLLGLIVLGEYHRKNSLEKAKSDQDRARQATKDAEKYKKSRFLWGVFTLIEITILSFWILIPSYSANTSTLLDFWKILDNLYRTDNIIYLLFFTSITLAPPIVANSIPGLFSSPHNKNVYYYCAIWLITLLMASWALRPISFIDHLKNNSESYWRDLKNIFSFNNSPNFPLFILTLVIILIIRLLFLYSSRELDYLKLTFWKFGGLSFWLLFIYIEVQILWPVNILGYSDDIGIGLGQGIENLYKPENSSSLILVLAILVIAGTLILWFPKLLILPTLGSPKEHHYFLFRILTAGIMGGILAILLPVAVKSTTSGVGGLRNSILLATGGLLAIITLGETRRKNDQDHEHQVHAERRSRYTKAIEQLADNKTSIRLGGIYTLVKLIDEWLADDKTTPNIEDRRSEGQAIINNLCTYIRSPFPLAERAKQLDNPYTKDLHKDFGGDKEKFNTDRQTFIQSKAALNEERQIRENIIKEICDRLRNSRNSRKPGTWSLFNYDFSDSIFFYPTIFDYSYFGGFSDFSGAIFNEEADFTEVTFNEDSYFVDTTFNKNVNLKNTYFIRDVDFNSAIFNRNSYFKMTYFFGNTNFSGTIFMYKPNFQDSVFYHRQKFYPYNINSHYFNVDNESRYKIKTKRKLCGNTKIKIPKKANIYNPLDNDD